MELVKGIPITDFCDEAKLSSRERLELFVDVCRAVQHAHQKGIIHRDLKPSNVMVTLHDDKPVVKVIDFGVSKALSSKLTEKTIYTAYGQMIGTPLYMSPEQAQLNEIDVDTRSDVYSLGVLLYELLTGTTPFDKDTLKKSGFDEMRRIIREVEPPRPSGRVSTMSVEELSTLSITRNLDPRKLSQSLRGELDWIVMKALEKDRGRRYESASTLAADIQHHFNHEPVSAKKPGLTLSVQKWCWRHPSMAIVIAAAVLLTLTTATAASVSRHYELMGLRNLATTAIEEAELDFEHQDYGRAVIRLDSALAQLQARPTVRKEYETRLTALLGEAETMSRVLKFEGMISEIRFRTNRVVNPLYLTQTYWMKQERYSALKAPYGLCEQALQTLGYRSDKRWQQRLKQVRLSQRRLERLQESLVEVLFLKARLEYAMGVLEGNQKSRTRKAIKLLNQIEQINPNLQCLYEYRSKYWLALDEPQKASIDAMRAKEITSSCYLDHFHRAAQLEEEGQLERAQKEYRAALSFRVDDYWSWHRWMRLRKDLENRLWAAAILVNLRPDASHGWHHRGYYLKGEAGVADLTKALERAEFRMQRAWAYFDRGRLQGRLGQYELGLADVSKACELVPNSGYFRRGLEELLKDQEDIEAAQKAIRTPLEIAAYHHSRGEAFLAIEQWPQAATEWLHSAKVLAKTKPLQARRDLEKALKLIEQKKILDETFIQLRQEVEATLPTRKD